MGYIQIRKIREDKVAFKFATQEIEDVKTTFTFIELEKSFSDLKKQVVIRMTMVCYASLKYIAIYIRKQSKEKKQHMYVY